MVGGGNRPVRPLQKPDRAPSAVAAPPATRPAGARPEVEILQDHGELRAASIEPSGMTIRIRRPPTTSVNVLPQSIQVSPRSAISAAADFFKGVACLILRSKPAGPEHSV